MSDLRSVFTSKDFVINSNVIKCISNLDITLDEFLLVLYFINVSNYLNNDDIKDKLGFDDDKIFSHRGNGAQETLIRLIHLICL